MNGNQGIKLTACRYIVGVELIFTYIGFFFVVDVLVIVGLGYLISHHRSRPFSFSSSHQIEHEDMQL